MKVLVVGAGAVGSYFGGRIAAAGADVVFMARGEQLAALQQRGLIIKSALGDVSLPEVIARSDPNPAGPYDVILNCVKMYDLAQAAEATRASVSERTLVVPVQNGVESAEVLRSFCNPNQIAAGFVQVGAVLQSPGVVNHRNRGQLIAFQDRGALTEQFGELCRKAKLEVAVSLAFLDMQWAKFARLSPTASICTVLRLSFGAVLENDKHRATLATLIDETLQVGKALGRNLEPDAEAVLASFPEFPYDWKPSMLTDLEHGKRLEAEWLCGAVHRFGERIGISTPANSSAYAALRPFINGTMGS